MKKLILSLLAVVISATAALAQNNTGKIVLVPYLVKISNNTGNTSADNLLLDRLNQIVTAAGMVGKGLYSPFIITANAVELEHTVTSTIPSKTALRLSLTIYIGNGEEGTLFSSHNMELKGVGDNLDQAYASAYRKINPRNPELLQAIETGKQKIVDYYDAEAPDILRKAETEAASGNYGEAYNSLLCIPNISRYYNQAQQRIAEYMTKDTAERNNRLINQARAAWSTNPNETGAMNAEEYLKQIEMPSATVAAEAKALAKEIAVRLQKVEDQRWAREEEEIRRAAQNAELAEKRKHELDLATIRAAQKVAEAQASSRVYYYNVYWW